MEFAEQLSRFRERVHARTDLPPLEGLIVLGTEPHNITAALLLGTLTFRHVAFLTTDDTRTFPQHIAEQLGTTAEHWQCPPGDHLDTTQVYQSVKALREAWSDISDPALIAVDVTGGRKPMSVGLEKAAHFLGLTTIYVESDYWPRGSSKSGPIPGTQRFVVPPDPYTVFGDIEAREAQSLYTAHDYAGAQRIFASLAARVRPPNGEYYRAAALLSAAYAAWDVLDFMVAQAPLRELLALPEASVPAFAARRAILEQQLAALEQLGRVAAAVVLSEQAQQTLTNVDAMLDLLGTLHAAALRRAAQGRYDFAALFRYRCLELISQHRLASYKLLTNAPKYKELDLPKAEVSARFQAIQRQIGRKQPKGLPDRIALFDGYLLLAALDDALLTDFALLEIEQRTYARNASVLAHGYRLIDSNEYAAFAQVVDQMIDRLFQRVIKRDRQAWETRLRFLSLPQ